MFRKVCIKKYYTVNQFIFFEQFIFAFFARRELGVPDAWEQHSQFIPTDERIEK